MDGEGPKMASEQRTDYRISGLRVVDLVHDRMESGVPGPLMIRNYSQVISEQFLSRQDNILYRLRWVRPL